MHTDSTVSKTSFFPQIPPTSFANCVVYLLLLLVHVPADKCLRKTASSLTFNQSSRKKGASDITFKGFLDLQMQKKEKIDSLLFWAVKRGWLKKKF